MEPRILNFAPASAISERADPARKAARLVRGDEKANDDPTCAHHAITNIFEEGPKAMDAVVRKMMTITDEMAPTAAKNAQARGTSIG
eukprot:6213313-Pleurochrysis_carterae.AAC.2